MLSDSPVLCKCVCLSAVLWRMSVWAWWCCSLKIWPMCGYVLHNMSMKVRFCAAAFFIYYGSCLRLVRVALMWCFRALYVSLQKLLIWSLLLSIHMEHGSSGSLLSVSDISPVSWCCPSLSSEDCSLGLLALLVCLILCEAWRQLCQDVCMWDMCNLCEWLLLLVYDRLYVYIIVERKSVCIILSSEACVMAFCIDTSMGGRNAVPGSSVRLWPEVSLLICVLPCCTLC